MITNGIFWANFFYQTRDLERREKSCPILQTLTLGEGNYNIFFLFYSQWVSCPTSLLFWHSFTTWYSFPSLFCQIHTSSIFLLLPISPLAACLLEPMSPVLSPPRCRHHILLNVNRDVRRVISLWSQLLRGEGTRLLAKRYNLPICQHSQRLFAHRTHCC